YTLSHTHTHTHSHTHTHTVLHEVRFVSCAVLSEAASVWASHVSLHSWHTHTLRHVMILTTHTHTHTHKHTESDSFQITACLRSGKADYRVDLFQNQTARGINTMRS